MTKVAWNSRRRRWRGGKPVEEIRTPAQFHYRQKDVDELLELIYLLEESGGKITGLVTASNDVVTFSENGKREAVKLIRAHRLAERLLTDVLLISKEGDLESQACEMEHILNPEIVDSICTILGHPSICPHGKEIPDGPCCKDKKRTAAPAVLSLDQLQSGESGRVLYVETTNHARLDKLTTFGMLPGTVIRVHQRQPSLVVLVGETQLAIDREIAQNVHVVKTSS
ncbi:MAG: metal-dependent transcriptional regulator [Candidatus Lindowbacteria bacterium]|nr:metal-dependent transcriptional regulator [Candidatus Lindowbacteria bacterium]